MALRSGSWMLCFALAQTGIAGRPSEYFGQLVWEHIRDNRNTLHLANTGGFMERMIEVSTTDNGVFGTKLPANHAATFLRRASEYAGEPLSSLKGAFDRTFPNIRYIHLIRDNTIAQAVSLYKASMTGQWVSKERRSHTPLSYDQYGLERCYQEIATGQAFWNGYFTAHNIRPIVVTYENLVGDYEQTMRRILRELGLPWHMDILAPQTARLADEQSREWEEEFRRQGHLPAPEPGGASGVFRVPF